MNKPESAHPADTGQASKEIYHLDRIYILIGDQLDDLLAPIDQARLNPSPDLTQLMSTRLSLVTAFQYAEHLPDTAAAEATWRRTDWKYALHLPVYYQGLDPLVLCHFRQNLYASRPAQEEFDHLLADLGALGLYARTTRGQLSSELVLQTVCKITRLGQLYTAMKAALGVLVANAPEWLRAHALPHWFETYRTGQFFLSSARTPEEMQQVALRLGGDIQHLLAALREQNRSDLSDLLEIQHLIQRWNDQFVAAGSQIEWRLPGCASCTRNQ